MQRVPLMPRIPTSAWLISATYLLIATCLWSFIFGDGFTTNWELWVLSFLAAVVFVGFGLSFWCLITLVPRLYRPTWLSQKQALFLSVACFVIQSGTAGVLTLLGAWPHRDLWFLGGIPFLFGS